MKSDLETAVQWSKRLESLLEQKLGASGKGLHQKVDSVRGQLAEPTQRKLRFVATVRNKIVHEESYAQMEDRAGFERACAEIIRDLEQLPASTGQRTARNPFPAWARARSFRRDSRPRVAALSPMLAVMGGFAGFTAAQTHGQDHVESAIFGVVGAALGWYWRPALVLAPLAALIYFGYKLLPA